MDIMFNLEKAHYVLEEMIMNGQICETNKALILAPLHVLDKNWNTGNYTNFQNILWLHN